MRTSFLFTLASLPLLASPTAPLPVPTVPPMTAPPVTVAPRVPMVLPAPSAVPVVLSGGDDEVDITATITFGAAGATSVTIDIDEIDTSSLSAHEGDYVFVWAGTSPTARPAKASEQPSGLPFQAGTFSGATLDLPSQNLTVAAADDRVWVFLRLGLKATEEGESAYSRFYAFEFREVANETYSGYRLYDLGID